MTNSMQVDAQRSGSNFGITRRGLFGISGAVAATAPLLGAKTWAGAAPRARTDTRPGGCTGGSGEDRHLAVQVDVGPEVTLVPPTNDLHQYPNSFAWFSGDNAVRKVLVGVNRHIDNANAEADRIYFSTVDDGTTWTALPDTVPHVVPRVQLRDSTLLGVGYYTYIIDGTGNRQATVSVSTSTDDGKTFVDAEGILHSDTPFATRVDPEDPTIVRAAIQMHDRAWEDPDGTIYQPAYGTLEDDDKVQSWLLATEDRGKNWRIHATVGKDEDLIKPPFDGAYEGLGETNIARLDDGTLYAVIRTGSWRPLYQTRSSDNGASWDPVTQIYAGAAAEHIPGINPKLRLLPNGLLVLMTGRDLIRLYVSPDGRGETWLDPTVVSGEGFESGNGGLEVLSHNRVLVIGDKRSNNRPKPDNPLKYHIWSRTVTITKNPLHRIDLAAELDTGTVTIDTNLKPAGPGKPGTAATALTDGFVEGGRRAIGARRGGAGEVTIDLGYSRMLTHVGVGGSDGEQRLTVATSTDGASWEQRHRETQTGPSVRLVPTPGAARYVRVTARGLDEPATISELEIYSEAITFSDTALGTVPYGFDATDRVVAVDDQTRGRVLSMSSNSDDDPQSCEYALGRGLTGARLSFLVNPVIPRSAAVCQIRGLRTTGLGDLHPAINLALRANGSLQWWDGEQWNDAAPAGTLKFEDWNAIVVECPTDRTLNPTVRVRDGEPREFGYAAPLMWDFRTVRFATSTSASDGQHVLLDQIEFAGL